MVGRKAWSKRRGQLEPARAKDLRKRVRVGRVSSHHWGEKKKRRKMAMEAGPMATDRLSGRERAWERG
jgi:hypothetical protein